MLSSEILGAVERNIRETIYGGVFGKHRFGGIPVVMSVGDDHQLPPVVIGSKGKVAFYIYGQNKISNRNSKTMIEESNGIEMFKLLTSCVMELKHRTRQEKDKNMTSFLDDIEKGQPCKTSIDTLLDLDIKHQSKHDQKKQIELNIYIFYTYTKMQTQLHTAF